MAGFSDYKCAIIQTTTFFYNVVCLSWFMVGIVSSERQPGQVTVCLSAITEARANCSYSQLQLTLI